MRTRWRWALAGAAVLVALAGCSSSGSSGASSDVARSAGAPGVAPGKAQVSVPAPGATDRKLARSAHLELSAAKVTDAVARARGVAQAAGGYTGQESSDDTSANLTLAVPADHLDAVLDKLAGLGRLTKRELSTQDVTDQVVDVDSRLATQRESVARIRDLLAKSTSISDIASVESELTSREAALESLEQQQASLAGQVAMASVTLSVTAETAAVASNPGFLGGLSGGWDAFLAFGGWLLTALGALAPFLLVLVPVGAATWWLLRRRRPRPVPGE